MAGAYSAVISVMTVMDNLKLHPCPPICLHPKQAESLIQHLTFLEEFLEKYDQTLPYSTVEDPFESRIADAAYAAEDAIESHIADRMLSDREGSDSDEDAIEGPLKNLLFGWVKGIISSNASFCKSTEADAAYEAEDAIKGDGDGSDGSLYEALEKVIDEMALIQKEAIAIKLQTLAVGVQHQPMPLYSIRSSSVAEKRSMVGVDDVSLELKDKLVSDRRDRQIIPIVGMGGTGKTSLAIHVYQDPLIKEHFDIRAWATISQEYSIREILVEVLRGLNIGGDKHLSEDALGEILYKYLFARRYLIVMDDMWSIEAWDGIRRFLPDRGDGSRIVVTTRLSDLASKLSNSNSLKMGLLDETSSWDLLSKTVFGEEGCPLELEEIGKEIGKSCKGLPLSIVVIGGFLAKSAHTVEFWKYIKQNLSLTVNVEDYERCLEILYMSYKQLPIYLKPCFLYMGVLPEDEVIEISTLVKLWVAEGFLKPVSGGPTLEERARVYLKDLADRNLVLIHEMSFKGNIKRCKIHDLLRDLCLREAEKERFYTLTCQGMLHGKRRIVINNAASKNEFINALPFMSRVRSLIWNFEDRELPVLKLRLLRIFYSPLYRGSHCEEIVKSVTQFVNSRFLQFSTGIKFTLLIRKLELPLSIWKFWNLQTLIVFGERIDAPTDIWYMHHIRHLVFPARGICLPDPPRDQDGAVLGNLQTLVGATNFKCSDQVVNRIPNLKKFKSHYEVRSFDKGFLTNLSRLEKLESLTWGVNHGKKSSGTVSLSSQINFPHLLKKLCLTIGESGNWEQDLLDKIGSLPFLQKLRLMYGRFEDGKWETTERKFPSLKVLELDRCKNLQVWRIESSHFPCLSRLYLDSAAEVLEQFPLEFAEVSTLRQIQVHGCTDCAVVSLKRILEENEELNGEADLQVEITIYKSLEEEIAESKKAFEGFIGPNFHIE